MSSITLEELQRTQYNMLCMLDDLCQKKDWKMTLAFGTALGAVRHYGFIPWDDDIDVMMKIGDYRKLKKYFLKHGNEISGVSVCDYQTDHETLHCINRLRLNKSVMPEHVTKGLNINNGIWLDILTCCDYARNEKIQKLQKYLVGVTIMMHEKYRNRIKVANGDTQIMNIRIYRIIEKMPEKIRLFTIDLLQRIIVMLGSKKSDKYLCLSDYVVRFRTFDRCFFDETTQRKFVEREFAIPKDYDRYLRQSYGDDYMTPIKQFVHTNVESVEIFDD